MILWLLRRLPPETAHHLAIFALRTRLWRVQLVIDALITLAWSTPLVLALRLFRKLATASGEPQ
jgi:hypothetical protein